MWPDGWVRTEVEAYHDLSSRGRTALQIRAVAVACGYKALQGLAEDALAGRPIAAAKPRPVVEVEEEVEVVKPVIVVEQVVVKPEPVKVVVKPVVKPVVGQREAPGEGTALAVAEVVLREVGKALTCQEMVEVMVGSGRWKTNGKTPDATLYVTLTRDIGKYGEGSPFVKVGKKSFEVKK